MPEAPVVPGTATARADLYSIPEAKAVIAESRAGSVSITIAGASTSAGVSQSGSQISEPTSAKSTPDIARTALVPNASV